MSAKKNNLNKPKPREKRAARRPLPQIMRDIEKNAPKTPVGRPTDYMSEIGPRVIAIMAEGYSLTAAAGALGYARQTFYDWMDRHPEFLDSVMRGKSARVFRLEADLMYPSAPHVVTARRFALVNAAGKGGRDGDTWRDKLEFKRDDAEGSALSRLAAALLGTAAKVDESNRCADPARHERLV